MPELRRNPITGHWVILAENRGGRPQEVDIQQIVRPQSICPFCEGHEERTPSEVLALRDAGSKPNRPGWRVRVVPNKFAALDEAETNFPSLHSSPASGVETMPAAGLHDIVIESPRHLASVAELNDAEMSDVLEIYRQRLRTLRESKKYQSAVVFKNSGPTAGATLVHLHSQLMTFQTGAPRIGDRLPNFIAQWHEHRQCPLCEMIGQAAETSIVSATKNFVAFCPFASRFAYEIWIAPRSHAADFDTMRPESLPELARLLRGVLVKLEGIVKLPAYNYIVHTAPFDTIHSERYHWHIEILPRVTSLAGFELGMGCYINTVRPERAAAAIREA